MAELVYRLVSSGCQIEVFDERVVVLHVGRDEARLSEEVATLAQLHDRGVLTDDEFTAAKLRVIRRTAQEVS